MPDGLPLGHGDEHRLSQVLLNLVSNAIKFTEAGEVKIEVGIDHSSFICTVSDTGRGISEQDQTRIFEEFQQADSSSTRDQGGTGLGLAISRKIIQMHGGCLWVESASGKGSAFHFTIPIRFEKQRDDYA